MPEAASCPCPPRGSLGAVPRLSYRNSTLPDRQPALREVNNLNDKATSNTSPGEGVKIHQALGECSGDTEDRQDRPRLSIRQLREAAQNAVYVQREQQPRSASPPPPQKKKSSLFGGLFQVREPTQVAIDQVTAQMIAQHGSISAGKVPNVRLEKMPGFVPKVNSKWDGVPEGVKQRDKRAKENNKLSDSSLFSDGHDSGRMIPNSRNSSSTTGSFVSRGRSSGSHPASARGRFYSQSVNSSGDLASQQKTDLLRPRAYSVQSYTVGNASATSLPEMESDPFPLREPVSPLVIDEPGRCGGMSSAAWTPPTSEVSSRRSQHIPTIDTVSSDSSSPVTTPDEKYLVAPPLMSEYRANSATQDKATLVSSGPGVLGPPAASKRTRKALNPNPLADETQKLTPNDSVASRCTLPLRQWEADEQTERPSVATGRKEQTLVKRSDSSRGRRPGILASMPLKGEVTPWEVPEKEASPRHSPKVASPRTALSPRKKISKSFGLFGRDKEKSSG